MISREKSEVHFNDRLFTKSFQRAHSSASLGIGMQICAHPKASCYLCICMYARFVFVLSKCSYKRSFSSRPLPFVWSLDDRVHPGMRNWNQSPVSSQVDEGLIRNSLSLTTQALLWRTQSVTKQARKISHTEPSCRDICYIVISIFSFALRRNRTLFLIFITSMSKLYQKP